VMESTLRSRRLRCTCIGDSNSECRRSEWIWIVRRHIVVPRSTWMIHSLQSDHCATADHNKPVLDQAMHLLSQTHHWLSCRKRNIAVAAVPSRILDITGYQHSASQQRCNPSKHTHFLYNSLPCSRTIVMDTVHNGMYLHYHLFNTSPQCNQHN
jgi:hypothetical protein